MKIVLITGHQYPVGTALTNRIRSYLEVLASLGHNVSVLIYRPSEDSDNIHNDPAGKLNGVSYRSTAHSLKKNKNPIIARLTWIYGYINCLNVLYKENRRKHIDVIIQASAKSSIIPLVYLFTRFTRGKFVLENSEYPWFILKEEKVSNGFYKLLYQGLYYKLFDGVLAMTMNLHSYHQRHSKNSARIFHLPMTVDMQRFTLPCTRENIVTYVGNVSYKKDGVDILLDAFAQISGQHKEWKLMIIGDTGRDSEIVELLIKAKLIDRVILKGAIHRDLVPKLLCGSKILALARPSSMQSEGGFPTKLGEYLSTGNLVVVTAVGEIPDYLEDGISALIAEPDSAESFADCLDRAISSYEEHKDIALNGYKVCKSNFNAEIQGRRLVDYFSALISVPRNW